MATPISDYAQLKNPHLTFHLIFANLHQHAKKLFVLEKIICSEEMVDLKKNLHSDWLRAFWPVSWEQDFS